MSPRAKTKKSPSQELGHASVEEEAAEREHSAAQKKLEAARLRAQARAIDEEEEQAPDSDESPVPEAPDLDGIESSVRARLLGEDLTDEEPVRESIPTPEVPKTKMEKILAGLNGDGKFVVHKMVAGNPMKVGVHDINDWPDMMDSIAHEHGGGTFRIRFMNPKGEWVGQETQTFDPQAYGKEVKTSSTDTLLMQMLQQSQAREERMALQVEQMRTQQQQMMLEFIKAGQSNHRERTAEEVVALMKATKEISGGNSKESPLESVKGILEVVAMLNQSGVGEPPSPINVAIERAFQLAGPFLGAWAAKLGAGAAGGPTPSVPQLPPARPAPLSLPDPRLTAAPGEAQPPSQAPVHLPGPVPQRPNPALKNYATSLLAAASSGQSPDSVAEAILSLVPEEELDNLHSMVSDPSFVGLMLATEPQLIQHQGWLVAVAHSIINGLTEESPSDSPPSEAPPSPVVAAVQAAPPAGGPAA
jgi:hypothetical protein